MKELMRKIQRKWMKLRLQPIRVFCFHHVSDIRNPLVCAECDWTPIDIFKENITKLMKTYQFISLQDAYVHLKNENFRMKRYAVLTADDGYRSLLDIIPWLDENKIPLTIFINSRFMEQDAMTISHERYVKNINSDADIANISRLMYMSKKEIWELSKYPNITIGMHGHMHLDLSSLEDADIKNEIDVCYDKLHQHTKFIPFYAYPWGRFSSQANQYCKQKGFIPVLITGKDNYTYSGNIDRFCLDSIIL